VIELPLTGCTPDPLMNYLKALGVFRLVAEQADATARLSWARGTAVLQSELDRPALEEFLLNVYQPTPILDPWNGGSGFYESGSAPLEAVAQSTTPRLEAYRATIAQIRTWIPRQKPKDDDKQALLTRCRAELPDHVVAWLDTCYVLGEDGVRYFPLLGTGGNDGRLDFINNFLQRLADVLSFDESAAPKTSHALIASSLFADQLVTLGSTAVGQFSPGGIGGANATQGRFDAGSQVNPWDYVLMIEGALLFAGSVARRLGSVASSRAVFPFSVDSVAVGYGSATASEETSDGSRAELWLPLWDNPLSLAETRYLFGEGRAQLGRRQARNAVEFALAVNLLGTSRGISRFHRIGFLKRNGLAFLATPLGQVPVQPRPQARLLNEPTLTDWLDRWRRATSDKSRTPGRYLSALRQIDRALFDFACRSDRVTDASTGDARWLLAVLRSLGRAERTLSQGLRFASEKGIRPLQRLPLDWRTQADDGSPEFHLAVALASTRAVPQVTEPLRVHLEEVQIRRVWAEWAPGSCSAVWSRRPLAENLAAVFRRRQLEAFQHSQRDAGLPVESPFPASLPDVLAFLREETDDEKLEELLWGLNSIDWSANAAPAEFPSGPQPPQSLCEEFIPMAFAIPRLLVQPLGLECMSGQWRFSRHADPITPDPAVFHELASGRPDAVATAMTRAARRLRSQGRIVVGDRNRRRAGRPLVECDPVSPARLLAAMLVPLDSTSLAFLANSVLSPGESSPARSTDS